MIDLRVLHIKKSIMYNMTIYRYSDNDGQKFMHALQATSAALLLTARHSGCLSRTLEKSRLKQFNGAWTPASSMRSAEVGSSSFAASSFGITIATQASSVNWLIAR